MPLHKPNSNSNFPPAIIELLILDGKSGHALVELRGLLSRMKFSHIRKSLSLEITSVSDITVLPGAETGLIIKTFKPH